MTIQVDNALPPNVVEIGNEITQGVVDGLMSASPSASSANPYATIENLSFLPLTGGLIGDQATDEEHIQFTAGSIILSYVNGDSNNTNIGRGFISFHDDANNTNGGISANSWSVSNGALQGDDAGITFPDSTVQTTAAVSPDLTGYLTKADNLASVTSISSARTNLGLAYATDAQVIMGTSTTTVLTPAGGKNLRYTNSGASIDLTPYSWLSSFTTWTGTRNRLNFPINGTTAIGQGMWTIENQFANIGGTLAGIDWSKRITMVGRFALNQTSPTSNNIFRYTLGKLNSTTFGDLTVRGIGVRCVFGSALEIQCHNGTGITNFSTSFTPTFNNTVFEVRVESDGSGNCTCFVNGTQVGTTTGAPTTASTGTQYNTNFELVSATTNTNAPTAAGSAFKVNYGQ